MIVKDTLEKRLVKLEVRSERVNFLESELKNYKQREQHFKDAADTLRKELENSKRKTKELDQENQQMKQMIDRKNIMPTSKG